MHWLNGAIPELYPHGTPSIVLKAVRDVDNGINAGQNERMKEITKKGGKS